MASFKRDIPLALGACLALAVSVPVLSAPAFAQDQGERVLNAQEEVLEDGQIVTRIFPGQQPEDSAPTPSRPPEQAQIDPKVPSVLVILSHPDDELIVAPVLARIARERGEVTLVFATSGDQGPGTSGLDMGKDLADLRESEARCAAFALGLEEPIFWRFGDGTLASDARNTGVTLADMGERIARLISLHQPKAVMTWGPDGGYGHADHRMTSSVVTQVVQAMGPARPDLLYAAFPASPGEDDEDTALPGFEGWARTHPSLITDRIGYEVPDLDATIAAVNCYESQFPEPARRVLAGMLHERVWRGNVPFRLAFAKAR